jgi:alpha-beta hydrolase superfamily lysophospholipase
MKDITTLAQKAEPESEKSRTDTEVKLVENLSDIRLKDKKTATNRTISRSADIQLKTGVRLHYIEQGNVEGSPVILLHGYSDSSYSYSRVLPLMNAKYRIFVLDQRGHGDSDCPWSGYNFSDFADVVVAFMDAKKLKKATIVGH